MRFSKYQALGNDYLVVGEAELGRALASRVAEALCDRHFGVGADGLLLAGARDAEGRFPLRIYNPDGSEAEKSGNGLRIHARHLFDLRLVDSEPFEVRTPGGTVRCRVHDDARSVSVEMGRVSFASDEIPVAGPEREVLGEALELAGRSLRVNAATVGNPHCVVFCDDPSPEQARELGPLLETNALFPRRTNVQLVQVEGRHRIRLEIWERGAGYTLASGTSSCAAAAVSVRLGLCDSPVTACMPGGELRVELSPDYRVTLTGPVGKVVDGRLCDGFVAGLGSP
ncbi:MAG: diaminopimelate epimerase [Myxococcota bacterium]|nr:diaminopimelate epimerase [Myxococcota bacterium]